MKLRTHIRSEKVILSTSGEIRYMRYLLIPADPESAERLEKLTGSKSVAPMDEMLGVTYLPFKMTVAMMLETAWYGAISSSYEEGALLIQKCFGCKPTPTTVREVTNYIGRMVYLEDCKAARRARWELENASIPSGRQEDDILYLMMDGAALNTRHQEKPDESTWKENKLCVAFRERNIRRWQVQGEEGPEDRHEILKREYRSFTGSVEEFKWHVLALANNNGYGKVKHCVIISDGATWIHNLRDELFPDAEHILDLYHLKENVYQYALEIFQDEAKAKAWAKRICKRLEAGKWESVLQSLEKYEDRKIPEGTVNLPIYIRNHSDMLDYPTYRKKGYFVGSGMIESGNKSVLQRRLKGPGMRWNVVTARYVLALKAKIESKMWESTVVPLVKKKLLFLKEIPERIPRSENEIVLAEKAALDNEIRREKMTWKRAKR